MVYDDATLYLWYLSCMNFDMMIPYKLWCYYMIWWTPWCTPTVVDEHVQRSMFSDDDNEYIDTDSEGYDKVYSGWWCLDCTLWWCETLLANPFRLKSSTEGVILSQEYRDKVIYSDISVCVRCMLRWWLYVDRETLYDTPCTSWWWYINSEVCILYSDSAFTKRQNDGVLMHTPLW